ncbi:MAG: Zn-dependent hydrolase, partial [Pseudomonadota bacterium]
MRLRSALASSFAIDVIGFGEEEGVRFGTTLMTSCATAGTFNPEWLQLQDEAGVTVAQALSAFGLDAARIGDASYQGRTLVGYLEAHIEQGPVLEALDLPLAVVTSIAGARRLAFEITGMAA